MFGDINRHLSYFIYAFNEMGKIGLGRHINDKRGRFTPGKRLFGQRNRIFHNYACMADLPDGIRPHSARATCITNALENGAKIEAV